MRRFPVLLAALLLAQSVGAQDRPATPPPADVFFARNVTRVEGWSFFEPRPGGGDPDYVEIGNRLLVGARHTGIRVDLAGALQYVQFAGLPDDAIGPGPLGSGANYYDHNRRSDSRQVYLRELNIRVKRLLGRLDLRAGRMSYASGAELGSGDASIEAVKRLRLDSRLLGDFEWSLYQRAWDGIRADVDQREHHITAAALWPTQGGFDEHANANLRDVRVGALTYGRRPARGLSHTELQAFFYDYRDRRPVAARPDNTGRRADRVDVHLPTVGASLIGSYGLASGRVDALIWAALQQGSWYGDDQQAWALALEGGHRWAKAPWTPWLRAGWNRASGDDDPTDRSHGTFVPLLPTARKYSLSTVYTFMNLNDVFAQVLLRPLSQLSLRADVHRLDLASAADRWYSGSGATRRTGTIFGYAGRASGGQTSLGTMIEGTADVTLTRTWSINGYAGWMAGGDVVRSLFAGDRLTFVYIENVVQF